MRLLLIMVCISSQAVVADTMVSRSHSKSTAYNSTVITTIDEDDGLIADDHQIHRSRHRHERFTERTRNNNQQLIDILRSEGKAHLSTGRYDDAADCYAAIIQNLEGMGGIYAGELLRRCGLTLAECEIKLGNLYDAIARCTEVINELPEDDSTLSPIDYLTLGKAYYRRGVSFQRLDMKQFAYLDMIKASQYLPNDTKIVTSIQILHEDLIRSNESMNSTSEIILEEKLQDTVEEASLMFPRRTFSSREIKNIARIKDVGRGSTKMSSRISLDMQSMLGLNNREGSVLDGSGLDGLGSLAGLAGLNSIPGIGGLISNIMEPGNLKNYLEIFNALNWFRRSVSRVITAILSNKHLVMITLTTMWCIRMFLA